MGKSKNSKVFRRYASTFGNRSSLIGFSKILLLDEPTAGLDPRQRAMLKSILRSLAKSTTVILCTHIVSDLSDLADQILIMNTGKKIDMQPPEMLMQQMEGKVWWCAETDETLRIHQEALHSLNNRVSGLRFIAENPPEYAVSVTPTLEDLYLYHFKEVSK